MRTRLPALRTVEGWREAIGLLRRALALDPSYALAAGLFAWCRVVQRMNRVISDEESKLSDREGSKPVGRDDRSPLGTIRRRAAVKTLDGFS
jgi:hypothetical protein